MSELKNINYIKLSSAEVTAYWWIYTIKSKISELSNKEVYSSKELKFMNLFYHYTEVEWRNIYLKLSKSIEEDVKSCALRNTYFCQATNKEGHDILNHELSNILGKKVPDIRLALISSKNQSTITGTTKVFVMSKSNGLDELSNSYTSSYILSGDEKELYIESTHKGNKKLKRL